MKTSKLWLITAACLFAAVVLTWLSMASAGPRITIRFDEGHGIKAGDTVRFRGIEVGQVSSVELTDDLSGIDAGVVLNSASERLAREGSRFWIVRPQLSLSGVSGLETAVGAKYIAVDPGDPNGPKKNQFAGFSQAPADGIEHDGITVKLIAVEKHGFSVGAPVTYRGLEVGRIIEHELSENASNVEVVARIDAAHQHLVTTSSRFWVSGGVGIDFGLSGFHMNADSLTSVAVGGVSFINQPQPDGQTADPVSSGQEFELHSDPDEDWYETPAPSLRDRIPFLRRNKADPKAQNRP